MPGLLVLASLLALSAKAVAAEPRPVSIAAVDGLILRGTWHASGSPASRAVLLLREMCGNRAARSPFLDGLRAAGTGLL